MGFLLENSTWLILTLPAVLYALRLSAKHPSWSLPKIAFWAGAFLPLIGVVGCLAWAGLIVFTVAGRSDGNAIAFAFLLLVALFLAILAIVSFLASWGAVALSRRK